MKKVIIDTDIGPDVDDTVALAVAHGLADRKEAEILAVTDCTTNRSGAITAKAINDWYGRKNIPVGVCGGESFMDEDFCRRYTAPVSEEYLKTHDFPALPDAVRVLRKVLSENDRVTLITIGMMNNIAALLQSEPDDISPLTGTELVNRQVEVMYSMAGNFEDPAHAEYNIKCNIPAAVYVSRHFPKPVVYCGFEIGSKVACGEPLEELPENHPVRRSFFHYSGTFSREAWDPITVFCAIRPETEMFGFCKNKTIRFEQDGTASVDESGKDAYIIMKADKNVIKEHLNELIR